MVPSATPACLAILVIHLSKEGTMTLNQKRPKYMQIIDAAVEVIAENGYQK
jgi:hypothetical protein